MPMLLITPVFQSTDYTYLWIGLAGLVALIVILKVINWLQNRKGK